MSRPSIRARRLARQTATATASRNAALALVTAAQADLAAVTAVAAHYRTALVAIQTATGAIKVPNGTTQKLARIANEGLANG